MLLELLKLYKIALMSGKRKKIKEALKDLEIVGVDKATADILVTELV